MKLKLIATIFISTALLSCTKKDDSLPRIETVKVNYIDFNSRVQAGSVARVDIAMFDNLELNEYTVELFPQYNLEAKSGFQLLTFSNIQNTSGKSASESFDLSIPANVTAGVYDMVVSVTDATGNRSPKYTYNLIVVSKDHCPIVVVRDVLTGGEKTPNSIYNTSRGRNMRFSGVTTDNKGITDLTIRVVNSFNKVEVNRTQFFDPSVEEFPLDSLSFDVEIPVDAIIGDHRLQWLARDTDGHMTFYQTSLTVQF
ncbi:MAG: hypothetical protein ACJAUV_002052 [Flavobacteriales bacterium]|jgi:hypothetical protein